MLVNFSENFSLEIIFYRIKKKKLAYISDDFKINFLLWNFFLKKMFFFFNIFSEKMSITFSWKNKFHKNKFVLKSSEA